MSERSRVVTLMVVAVVMWVSCVFAGFVVDGWWPLLILSFPAYMATLALAARLGRMDGDR